MGDGKLGISDMVTHSQEKETSSLRRVLDVHGLEEELPGYEPETYDSPIELRNNIYLWELKEDLPDELPDANYIIIDVIYFSTTAVEALSNGVETMYLKENHEDVLAVEAEDTMLGGESADHEPKEGFDFFNSPTNVRENGISGKTAMTSQNGAKAALKVSESAPDSADIYIGSTSNAKAVGELLQDSDKPTHIICSGTRGSHAAEDHIGAYLIARYLEGQDLDSSEIETAEELLELAKDYLYQENIPDIRQNDVQEYVKAVNSRESVPKLVSAEGEEYLRPVRKV